MSENQDISHEHEDNDYNSLLYKLEMEQAKIGVGARKNSALMMQTVSKMDFSQHPLAEERKSKSYIQQKQEEKA